jgi:putative endonuclease
VNKGNLTAVRWTLSGELREYSVYILSNASMNLYTGVTNDLERRVIEHKLKLVPGFTSRYHFDRLVYFEYYNDPQSAIAREKQIKGLTRKKKIALVKTMNPQWMDLSKGDDDE